MFGDLEFYIPWMLFLYFFLVRGEMTVMKEEISRLKGGGKGQGTQNPEAQGKGKGQ